jgi:hypothetical protein
VDTQFPGRGGDVEMAECEKTGSTTAGVPQIVDTTDNPNEQRCGVCTGMLNKAKQYQQLCMAKFWHIAFIVFFIAYTVYLGFALSFDPFGTVFICFVYVIIIVLLVRTLFGAWIRKPLTKCRHSLRRCCKLKPRTAIIIRG